ELPEYLSKMVYQQWLGEKSGQGFYKKIKDGKGKSIILSLDLNTLEYNAQSKVQSPTLEMTKQVEDIAERMKVYESGKDKAAELFRAMHYPLFEYVSKRVPEITDDFYQIDKAMRAGFGWELGPFEVWDSLGVEETLDKIKNEEKRLPGQSGEVAQWGKEMLSSGCQTFYKVIDGNKHFYDINTKSYQLIPGEAERLSLNNLRDSKTLWKNSGTQIIDLGDGVINCEFRTKMNTIGGDVIQGINKAINLAEKEGYKAL